MRASNLFMFSAISWFICIQMYLNYINLYQTMYTEHLWCEQDVISLKIQCWRIRPGWRCSIHSHRGLRNHLSACRTLVVNWTGCDICLPPIVWDTVSGQDVSGSGQVGRFISKPKTGSICGSIHSRNTFHIHTSTFIWLQSNRILHFSL
jgi:hypothetical protein